MAISTVSFTKTPQAGDDLFTTNEDSSLVMDLDVMANDLGGAAKKLYSIDSGDSTGQTDLLGRDVAGAAERSAKGALISIVNGKVHYDASALSAQLQSLQAGEFFEDSFTYAIQMGNGTLSWASATVRIAGVNDIASMSGDQSGGVTEDGPVSVNGTLTVVDADHDQSQAQSADANSALGHYTVNASGQWSYTVDNAAIQHLAAGAQTTDSFVVTSLDGTASKTVTITITGVNDAASISGDTAGAAGEDSTDAITGALSVSDVDDGEAHAVAASGQGANHLGTFAVDADGNWSYSVDNAAVQHLAAGATATDSFTVASADGTASQVVTITINGENDTASITGSTSGSVTEAGSGNGGGVPSASGDVNVSDVDDGQSAAAAASGTSDNGYGSFTVNAGGHWTYTLDNSNAAVNSLNNGQHLSDSFTIASLDGSASTTVTIDIVGASDSLPPLPPPPPLTSGDPNNFDNMTGSQKATQESDTLVGTSGPDNISGLGGGDKIYGTEGDDQLQGNSGNDTIYGGSGDDTLHGNEASDTLYGGDGNDRLIGDGDNDTLIGGYGNDTLEGNGGNDTYKYLSPNDRTDVIASWNSGDKIDIHDLLAANPGVTWSLEGDGAGGTNLMIDVDGSGPLAPVVLADVLNATLTTSDIVT